VLLLPLLPWLLHDFGIGGLFAEGDLDLIDAAMESDHGVRSAGLLVSTHFKKWQEMGLRRGIAPSGLP
jgi:hypothetical protein